MRIFAFFSSQSIDFTLNSIKERVDRLNKTMAIANHLHDDLFTLSKVAPWDGYNNSPVAGPDRQLTSNHTFALNHPSGSGSDL